MLHNKPLNDVFILYLIDQILQLSSGTVITIVYSSYSSFPRITLSLAIGIIIVNIDCVVATGNNGLLVTSIDVACPDAGTSVVTWTDGCHHGYRFVRMRI